MEDFAIELWKDYHYMKPIERGWCAVTNGSYIRLMWWDGSVFIDHDNTFNGITSVLRFVQLTYVPCYQQEK